MTFPGIGPAHDTILNKTEWVFKKFAWMSFPKIGMTHALESPDGRFANEGSQSDLDKKTKLQ